MSDSVLECDRIQKHNSDQLTLVNPVVSGYFGLTLPKSVSYVITDTDKASRIEVDTTDGDKTITMPLMANNPGRRVEIAHVKGTNKVIVSPNASDANKLSSDGLNVIWLPKKGNFAVFQESSTGSCWEITNERIFSQLRLDGYAGHGSTDTKIMRFTTLSESIGNMFSENHSTGYSSNAKGLEITANRSGHYSFMYQLYNGTDYAGLSLNSSQLTTNIQSITTTTRLAMDYTLNSGTPTWVGFIKKGDIVRPHTNAVAPSDANITISYLG